MTNNDYIPYNTPMWARLDRVKKQYPWLCSDIDTNVCVIGGGLVGALCSLRLREMGLSVVLITEDMIGMGSTGRAMPCAEFDMGESFRDLIRRLGEADTVTVLRLGLDAIDRLEQLSEQLGDFGCSRRDGFMYTDDDSELEQLGREFTLRRRLGFDCSYVSRSSARDVFSFDVAGGIMSKGSSVCLDPYKLTAECAERSFVMGASIYENTKALRLDKRPEGGYTILTSTHHIIDCKRVIVATGDSCSNLIDGLGSPRTGFTVVSKPLAGSGGWPGLCVLRSFSSPEITVSLSPDGRIFAGGLSTGVVDEQARLGGVVAMPSLHEKRFRELMAGAGYLFPSVQTVGFELSQAARYRATTDGLPIVGEISGREGCVFAISGDPSGLLYSITAAEMAAALCSGEQPEHAELFAPRRKAAAKA